MTTFDDFIAEIEAEARAQGPDAVAELEAFRLHFSLARQLAAQRRAQHLTQKQLAERSGIDQAEISRIERGQANPTTATLGALTGALGLDVQLVRPCDSDGNVQRDHGRRVRGVPSGASTLDAASGGTRGLASS